MRLHHCRSSKVFRFLLLMVAAAFWVSTANAFDANLQVTPEFSQAVGARSTLLASTSVVGSETMEYQFSVREIGGPWRIVRDFDEYPSIEWSSLDEGSFELRLVAWDTASNEGQVTISPYSVLSRVVNNEPTVNLLQPLVALYSAPPCNTPGFLRVRFRPAAGNIADWTTTPPKPCVAGKSVNFILAGMTANTVQIARHEGVVNGSNIAGPPVAFSTDIFDPGFAGTYGVPVPANASASVVDDVLLLSYIGGPDQKYPLAMNLQGNLIWYYEAFQNGAEGGSLLRILRGGTMLVTLNSRNDGEKQSRLAEVDLAGNILRETTITAVNHQLAALGEPPTSSFHHDAIRLPNGYTAVLGSTEQVITDLQGPGDVDVIGDTIYVLDKNFQLVWSWNAFDHLDVSEVAILGETCVPGGGGCPPLTVPVVNDWTHANSLDYTAGDGNLVINIRHLDAVFKLNYADGAGTGEVVWRLGKDGDFLFPAGEWPWFSHAHYVHFEDGRLVVYDNGNTRVSTQGSGNSRVQTMTLDETGFMVNNLVTYDLGVYAPAVGSAEILSNGNISADNGFLSSDDYPFLPAGTFATLVSEFGPFNQPKFVFISTAYVYRAWRMRSLYEPNS